MGLQLVSTDDGKPIGWWRFFLRQLVFGAAGGTVVGLVLLPIFLVVHERRQGWHDLAAGSIAIRRRTVAVRPQQQSVVIPGAARGTRPSTAIGLPPHLLAATFRPPSDDLPAGPPIAHVPGFAGPSAPAAAEASPADAPAASVVGDAPPQSRASWTQPDATAGPGQPAPWQPPPGPEAALDDIDTRVGVRAIGDDDGAGTRLVAPGPAAAGQRRPGNQGWYLRLDDGREIELDQPALIGRNPARRLGDPEVQLIAVSGSGTAVSKVHLLIGTDKRGVHITDRASTNGTALVTTHGLEPCVPGVQMRAREGQIVSFGDRSLSVLRRPEDG